MDDGEGNVYAVKLARIKSSTNSSSDSILGRFVSFQTSRVELRSSGNAFPTGKIFVSEIYQLCFFFS